MELMHTKPRFDFVSLRTQILAFTFSGLLTLLSIGSLLVQGLNLGIDFSGGILVQVRFEKPPHVDQVRAALSHLHLGDVSIQQFGSAEEILIRIGQQSGNAEAQGALANKVVEAIKPTADGGKVELRRVEFVGPQVGSELVQSGLWAVFYSFLAILLYIAWRFEWRFAVGAILSLLHDVVITMGLFSVTQKEFTLVVLAAVLTIIGYSINDTIVVFDRVREERIRSKKLSIGMVINRAINDTLSRTIIVSLTVILVLVALLIFGGLVIHDFALALFVGVLLGTFSSIFVACQTVLLLDKKGPVTHEQPAPPPVTETP
ncbi:MAG: protein translocase subunit SecF [Magnetococcales bacterium]|nr:protein translocase subunit SecF [Magnetococcales bacterium]MBF0113625.1 protein translocase subunit SecF [Magnetococcales bacterium]